MSPALQEGKQDSFNAFVCGFYSPTRVDHFNSLGFRSGDLKISVTYTFMKIRMLDVETIASRIPSSRCAIG
jgi:hypothetical protein